MQPFLHGYSLSSRVISISIDIYIKGGQKKCIVSKICLLYISAHTASNLQSACVLWEVDIRMLKIPCWNINEVKYVHLIYYQNLTKWTTHEVKSLCGGKTTDT